MFSETLRLRLAGIRATTAWPHPGRRAVLIANLVFLHQVIVASEPLLRHAIARTYSLLDCPFRAALLDYLQTHLVEERDHAAWLEQDLISAGVDPTDQPLSLHAVETVGAQYYLINHATPAALLGYMAFLECFPMPLEQVAWLEQVHGKELLRTVRYHAEHDVDHGKSLINIIDRVPQRWQAVVYNNGARTAERFCAAAMTFGEGD